MSPNAVAELTALRPLHSPLRLLFPLQSGGQALSVALAFGAIAALGYGVVRLGGHDPDPGLFLAAFAGGLPSLYFSLPGEFEVHTRGPVHHWLGDVEKIIRSMGYRVQAVEQPGQAWRYRLNHPRWARWTENEIVVCLQDEQHIAVHGPKRALKRLRRDLARMDGVVRAA